jgi:hypothetical protein
MIKREVRERVFAKYNEHCAYCGKIIAPPYKTCETLYLVFNNKVIQATVKEITKTNTGLYYKVETEFGLMLRATAACLCLTREEAEEKIKK